MARGEGGANTSPFFLSLYRTKVMTKMITNWKRGVLLHETQNKPAFLMYFYCRDSTHHNYTKKKIAN